MASSADSTICLRVTSSRFWIFCDLSKQSDSAAFFREGGLIRRTTMSLTMTTWISSAMRILTGIALFLCVSMPLCAVEHRVEFHRVITVSNSEPVTLALELASGDLEIVYSRDGQVSVSLAAQVSRDSTYSNNDLQSAVVIEQSGNELKLRQVPDALGEKVKIRYRLEVPYRTAVTSVLKSGKIMIRGVSGPIDVSSADGDVNVSYVSEEVRI